MPESRTISTGAGASRSQRDRVKYMSPRVIGIRTDTSAKNATDIGLTQDQKKMVLAEEGRIRGRQTEYAAIISPEGKVVRRLGDNDAHHVSFAGVPGGGELKDAVVVHNHPQVGQRKTFGNTIATRVGSPLSAQDLIFAASHDVAEMRATTYSGDGGGYIYSIRRPANGWKMTDRESLFDQMLATRNRGQRMANEEFSRIARNPSGSPAVDKQRASRGELMAQWKSIQEMAEILGSKITRRKF